MNRHSKAKNETCHGPDEAWNQKKGKEGEAIARAFLEEQGYEIVELNFHTTFGEIDLIVQKERVITFIEVKARSAEDYGDPLMAITPRKLQHLQKAAWIFLQARPQFFEHFYHEFAAIAVRDYLQNGERIEMVSILPKGRF